MRVEARLVRAREQIGKAVAVRIPRSGDRPADPLTGARDTGAGVRTGIAQQHGVRVAEAAGRGLRAAAQQVRRARVHAARLVQVRADEDVGVAVRVDVAGARDRRTRHVPCVGTRPTISRRQRPHVGTRDARGQRERKRSIFAYASCSPNPPER